MTVLHDSKWWAILEEDINICFHHSEKQEKSQKPDDAVGTARKIEGRSPDPEDVAGRDGEMEGRSLNPKDVFRTAGKIQGRTLDTEDEAIAAGKIEGRSLDSKDVVGTEGKSPDPEDAAALIARVERCRDLEDVKTLLKISFSQLQVIFFSSFCFTETIVDDG